MVATSCFTTPLCSFSPPNKPVVLGNSVAGKVIRVNKVFHNSKTTKFQSLEVKATDSSGRQTKTNSIVCADCDGNGAISCTQCKGVGVNSVDHFNGAFKAGGLCWLCRGKRDILCGSCNGAGFIGGFMSTYDD
ncbi:protein BUNDLE SHEATH DEFECTIVE 2, chloroplastic isoform X2 [Mercurialis annua]|uniref:protein BUNDLE SHEATH DEFECTIVE 2, chloroplastic isoform X2 n=1 Tax=Mercurialis annua TaxID=3986 RepID=UPI00215E4731|nr:protein BUNDLE SHEATH DEFECTIVE 2, chloroplastic isoform X2 [Mercurialis annua]